MSQFEHVTNVLHPDSIYAVDFTRDGVHFATSSFDKKVRLYDAATLECERAMHTGANFMHAVAFDPDGARVASGGKSLCLFDVKTHRRLKIKIKKFKGEMHGIVFTEDGTRAWIAGEGYLVCVDLTTGARIVDTKLDNRFFAMSASPDGSLLAAATSSGRIVILDAGRGQILQDITGSGWLYQARFSPDGKWVWVSGDPHVIRAFDVATGALASEVETRGHARDFVFDPLDPDVVIGVFFNRYSRDCPNGGWVEAFDVSTGKSKWQSQLFAPGFTQALAISPDGSMLVNGMQEVKGEVETFEGETATLDDGDMLMIWRREV